METAFSTQHFGIDDCCEHLLTIDTATGEPSINMGRIQGSPQIQRWWGMTWDATTDTLYAVGADDFSIFADTNFFLARIDRGHEVVATIIGGLLGIPQGVAIVGIAVDPIGRMFESISWVIDSSQSTKTPLKCRRLDRSDLTQTALLGSTSMMPLGRFT